jgi:D-alanine-D-alanine ligase
MGGTSNERKVSLVTGKSVVRALNSRGFETRPIDYSGDVTSLVAALSPAPDVVFNAFHGRFGEDGCIQGLLELLGLRYTHSGVMASALAMDKPMAKRLFVAAGIPCTEHVIARRREILAGDVMERPYVIKPLNEGSSVGVRIVSETSGPPPLGNNDWPFGEQVMVERYIPGREITVAVMGDRSLAVTELRPKEGFYDYDAKYTDGMTDHLIPAPIPEAQYEAALGHALAAHRALGCHGVSRADFRYDDTTGGPGELCLLEINTQPGLTPLSLVPEQAAHVGINFGEMVAWMVENASCDS